MERIGAQLRANQAQYLIDLMQGEFATVALGGYRVPATLARYISCWSQTDQDAERLIDQTELSCQSEDDIFLAGDLNTGAIRFDGQDLTGLERPACTVVVLVGPQRRVTGRWWPGFGVRLRRRRLQCHALVTESPDFP